MVDIILRFIKLTDERGEDECWPWLGAPTSSGHGLFFTKSPNIVIGAHVFAYCLYTGQQPVWDVHHKCEMKLCVNGKHLEDLHRSDHMKAHGHICTWGHDKRIVGRNKSGACKQCTREYNKMYARLNPR